MIDNEIYYVSELLEAHLSGYNSVRLPGIGSLKCALVNSSLNHMTGALRPPHYVVEYYSDSDDVSMITLISNTTGISEQNAESIYNRWCEFITCSTETTKTYRIDKVGILTVNILSESALFSPDKDLALFLNPFGDDAEQRLVIPKNIDIEKKVPTDRKKNSIMTLAVCLVVFIAAIVGFVVYELFKPQAQFPQATEIAITPPVVTIPDTTTIDSIMVDNDSITISPEPVAIKVVVVEAKEQPASDKGYHIIISTFSTEERAIKYLDELKKDGEKPLMVKTENQKTPYYVSLGVFSTKEEANVKMRTIKREELWIYLLK